jgi:hypothetical protein
MYPLLDRLPTWGGHFHWENIYIRHNLLKKYTTYNLFKFLKRFLQFIMRIYFKYNQYIFKHIKNQKRPLYLKSCTKYTKSDRPRFTKMKPNIKF